ncbi:MAG: hypothetical protein CUN56_13275 [Phototrophicales bacterium]|nr:MAG: hypothetical protein CUN56_13275 [Phototrophicales bacterium]
MKSKRVTVREAARMLHIPYRTMLNMIEWEETGTSGKPGSLFPSALRFNKRGKITVSIADIEAYKCKMSARDPEDGKLFYDKPALSVRELAETYGVSPYTVRRSIELGADEAFMKSPPYAFRRVRNGTVCIPIAYAGLPGLDVDYADDTLDEV